MYWFNKTWAILSSFFKFDEIKDPKKEFEPKFRVVITMDGKVDLSKFEIKIRNSDYILKVIRDGNEKPN